ncbi:hypothetical protein JTB14_005376 [Gonioctena quinquepunctata]|nr:hypothetical protein JTB14_005376 [Gonioctena quinquepunctata]
MKGLGILNVPTFKKDKYFDSDVDVNVSPKPTLHIQKKDGSYWITMNPLKDPTTLVDNEDPYMDCTPMQFKITKNKQKLPNEGFYSLPCLIFFCSIHFTAQSRHFLFPL